MAWSVKLSDGTTEYELVYDAAAQDDYKLHYGMRISSGEPNATWHMPDSGPARLVRAHDENKQVYLTYNAYGADWDEVLSAVSRIKRMVDGARSQAARYHTHGDTKKVYLRITPDGATNYTDFTVIIGGVDDSGSYYSPPAVLNKIGVGVVVALTLEPHGYGATITLRNDMASSPHFVEDSNADGLADGWALVGSPTATMNTTEYLMSGKCQKIVTGTSASEGVSSTSIAAASGVNFVAYVWVYIASGDDVLVQIRNGSGVVLDGKNVSNGSDKTAVSSSGGTWRRVSFASTTINTNGVLLYVFRSSSVATQATTFYVDGAYISTGVSTIPAAFSSVKSLYSRNDPVTANPERINYLDVWGIPGDAPALVSWWLDIQAVTGTKKGIVLGRQDSRAYPITRLAHWVDSASCALTVTTGSSSSPSDAARAGGSYLRYTAAATPLAATLEVTIPEGAVFATIPHHIYLICRSSSAATAFSSGAFPGCSVQVSGKLNAANTWEMAYVGYITKGGGATGIKKSVSLSRTLTMTITPGAASATTDIDAVLLVPANDDGNLVGESTTAFGTSNDAYIFPDLQQFYYNGDERFGASIGALWTAVPGTVTNRYVFAMFNPADQVHTLTDSVDVVLTITPRSRHLLGGI